MITGLAMNPKTGEVVYDVEYDDEYDFNMSEVQELLEEYVRDGCDCMVTYSYIDELGIVNPTPLMFTEDGELKWITS